MLRISITLLLACASAALLTAQDGALVTASVAAVCVEHHAPASGPSTGWTLADCRA